jgi:probable rRNA maturation factor
VNEALAIEVRNDTRYRVDEAAVAALARGVLRAEGVTAAELGVGFIGELRMRSLNRDHLGADYVTDVLAFPLEEPDEALDGPAAREGMERRDAGEVFAGQGADKASVRRNDGAKVGGAGVIPRLLGDVVVCLKRAERQAGRAGLPLSLETAVLLVHGILHVLGYDHETDAGRMALRQAELLESLAWDGLIAPPTA